MASGGVSSSIVMQSSSSWSLASRSVSASAISASVSTPRLLTSRAVNTASSVWRAALFCRRASVSPATRSRASASFAAGTTSAASRADIGRAPGPRRAVFSGDFSNSARVSLPSPSVSSALNSRAR